MEVYLIFAIYAGGFVTVGLAMEWLRRRYPLRHYGPQPVTRREWGYLAVSLVLGGAFQYGLGPFIADGLIGTTWVEKARDVAAQTKPAVHFLLYVVLTDFLSYWSHRLLHTRRLWPTHAFHHAQKSLNGVSGLSGSFPHHALTAGPLIVASTVIWIESDFKVFIAALIFDLVTVYTIHSNWRMPFAKALSKVFITPGVHFVHHHPNPRYTDTNFGFVFSIWDRMFGTFTDPDSIPENEKGLLGLDYEMDTLSLIVGAEFTERVYPEDRKLPGKKAS